MQKFLLFLSVLLMTFSLGVVDAEAKRLGGGRSFGMHRSIEAPSRPATPPSFAPSSPARAPAPGMAPQAPRRGFGWGGALAGLAAGGLLGALLFGGGFNGINPFDIMILLGVALVVFLIFRAMRRKQAAAAPDPQGMAYVGMGNQPVYQPQQGELEPDDAYRSRGGVLGAQPAGFDEVEFLHGAKAAFNRLQADWDAKDLNDLRRFTTPEMYGELSAQIQEQGDERNVTEVLNLDAQLLDLAEEGDRWVASVRYDGMIREQVGGNPDRVMEIWHFIRPKNAQGPTWYLAGIQQS